MAFYHSHLFDLRATGERIQRMANKEQAEQAMHFVSWRNKAYLIGILCTVWQWVFFQRQFLIPALLTFFFAPVQDHFRAGSVCVKQFLPLFILTNTFHVENSSVQCFRIQMYYYLNEFITVSFLNCYIFQLYTKSTNKLLANVYSVMITAENKHIERRIIWFNYYDQ